MAHLIANCTLVYLNHTKLKRRSLKLKMGDSTTVDDRAYGNKNQFA
jgi:hypothetical protein